MDRPRRAGLAGGADVSLEAYRQFLSDKAQLGRMDGFAPIELPDYLFGFQAALVDWALRKGRAAIFADCGLGKTIQQLVWADNVVRHTNRPVLILTPLAVSHQTLAEAGKFGIEASRSRDGRHKGGIVITNYERLDYFDAQEFVGCVCDESSILKNFDGVRRAAITEFMKKLRYRLLCTATAAPNDYVELGTSSEALGELGYTDMLTKFFKNDQGTIRPMRYTGFGCPRGLRPEREATDKWRFKGHAEQPFWRWVSSWARAVRRPSDLGFPDDGFVLPPLIERDIMIGVDKPADGMLFSLPAVGLAEQRSERRRTIEERCELAASLVADTGKPALMWCHLNDEGDLLEKMVKGAVQISGDDDDDEKEEKFIGFANGHFEKLITKPKIGAWGLNFQNCAHITTFPSHSFEQYYQSIRRCWRFGQTKTVTVEMITTEGEKSVLHNLQRKASAADRMFDSLVAHMNNQLRIDRLSQFAFEEVSPPWL
jgi:hypothetical protein